MKFFIAIFSLLIFFSLTTNVFALDSSNSAIVKPKLTFPIVELGNCTSISDCRAYCNIPTNSSACIDFAKKKAFYKPPQPVQTDILASVKTELGCISQESCKELCSQPDNFQKCADFAKKHQLTPPKVQVNSAAILSMARQFLNCDSLQSCVLVCSQTENHQKCAEFARKVGLQGIGDKKDNRPLKDDLKPISQSSGPASLSANLSTVAFGQFCRSNPGKCAEDSKLRYQQFVEFCKTNPEKCLPPRKEGPSYATYPATKSASELQAYCAKYAGCIFDGARCQCNTASQSANVFGADTSNSLWGRALNFWHHIFK